MKNLPAIIIPESEALTEFVKDTLWKNMPIGQGTSAPLSLHLAFKRLEWQDQMRRAYLEKERISNLAGLSEPSDYKGRH